MYFELSLQEVLERAEKKVKQQKNSYLERQVITYRIDMKTRPKYVVLGNVYINKNKIKDIEQYKVVFYDEKREVKELYDKLLNNFFDKKSSSKEKIKISKKEDILGMSWLSDGYVDVKPQFIEKHNFDSSKMIEIKSIKFEDFLCFINCYMDEYNYSFIKNKYINKFSIVEYEGFYMSWAINFTVSEKPLNEQGLDLEEIFEHDDELFEASITKKYEEVLNG